MLTELFTSKTRIKLLLKLFLNPDVSCYLRELSNEFSISPNAVKGELDNLSEAGYLNKIQKGRSFFFSANQSHPFFDEIHSIVRKTIGIDRLVDQILSDLGNVKSAYVLDDYAIGRDSGLIDLLIIGDLDINHLEHLRAITEERIKRKIRIITATESEFSDNHDVFMSRPNWKIV